MDSCGLIVEYNPFHNGHYYHLNKAKEVTNTDCTIAVMSGNFLQRGEPAIIDKFHRAKIAVEQGVDIVVELPYVYAVQNSDIFSHGAILILGALGVSSICFGSEHGEIAAFTEAYYTYKKKNKLYQDTLKKQLATGLSFPEASRLAYQSIGLTNGGVDLSKPNNILGFGYVKAVLENFPSIRPTTIRRTKNDYHDSSINHEIASATSIRKEILLNGMLTQKALTTFPTTTQRELEAYKQKAGNWHEWEAYFPYLQYRVLTMQNDELRKIHGVIEGLENRIRATAKEAINFEDWMTKLKTKRYTWTRLQRMFVHILTNTKKSDLDSLFLKDSAPYIRLLAMSNTGQAYLNKQKKEMETPIITGLKRNNSSPFLAIEEKASDAYYSIIPPKKRSPLRYQEVTPPYIFQ